MLVSPRCCVADLTTYSCRVSTEQYGKMLTDYLSQTCGKEFVQARSMPAIIPSPSQQSQSSDELSMVPDSPQLNFNLDPHHPAMVEA